MKSTPALRFSLHRLFLLTLVSFVAVAALLGIAASANKATRTVKASEVQAVASKSALVKNSVALQQQSVPQPNAPAAASMTATLTDNVAPGTKVPPGGTINYTALLTNNGVASPGDDAGSVVYNATLNPNTTLSGLVSVSPVTINDTYPQTVIGNVSVDSSVISYSVFGNDYQGQNGGALSITASNIATANGGQVVMTTSGANIGQFTYNPPPGFEGNDTFTYTLLNSVGSSTGTVTIPVSGMVWFINNNSVSCTTLAGGCGRLSNPFSSLGAFQALNNGAGNNPAINDNIFVFESATTYTGGVTLLAGQKFIGQDSTDTLVTITGLTPPTSSTAFPAMNTGAPATTITSGVAGIALNGTSTSNTIRGLTVTNTTGAKISGTNFGTLTVGKNGAPDVTLSGTGQALNLTTGTFAATSAFTSVAATSSTTTGISLTSVAGTVAFGSTTTASTTNQGILVNTSGANINFGNTSVTTAGGTGVNLTTNTGTATFADLDVSPNSGQRGLLFQNNTGALTSTTGDIITASNVGVEITGASSASKTPLNLQLTKVTASSSSSGIVLTNTSSSGSPGGFRVIANGGTCSTSANCTGGAITNMTNGILLATASDTFFDRMFVQNTTDTGVKGSLGVTNFGFTNGVVDTSGTGGGVDTSNIGLNATGIGTEKNVTGTVTITGNTLKNAHYQGIDIFNYDGTLTDANISANTLTSYTTTGGGGTTSVGSGIRFVAFGGATTVANITKATLNNNIINNFPGAVGLQVQCGNANSPTASPSTCGTPGDATNIIAITNNQINKPGNGATTKTGAEGIIALVNARGQGNFNISGNNVQQTTGTAISSSAFGFANVTETINNNIIVANNTVASQGIGIGTSSAFSSNTETPHLTSSINGNNISQVDGNGILAVARGASGTLDVTIKNNTVAAPLTGVRQGIRVDAGNASSADDAVCLDISGNTSAPSVGQPAALGIGLRKQGTNPTINDFGIEGMAATATPGVEAFVNLQNPAGGGTLLISATSGFSTCASAPALPAPGDVAINGSSSVTTTQAMESALPTMETLRATVTAGAEAVLVAKLAPTAINNAQASINTDRRSDSNDLRHSHHAQFKRTPSLKAGAGDNQTQGPLSGEAIGPISIGTLPAGKSVTIKYAATVNGPPVVRQVSHQGTVTFTNGPGSPLLTDDTDLPGGAADPTVTLIDTTETWTGATSSDWNVASNWSPAFVPNSVSDVVIPNAGVTFEPNIITPDVNVFSLDLQSARTLTINSGRTLTVNSGLTTLAGALAGGPYTLNFVGLTINRAAGVTINGPTSVTGVLTLMSGNVTTGANVLTLASASTIVRTSGHIIGSLKKTNVTTGFVFTVGTVNGYTPLDITTASGGGDLTVTTTAAQQPTLLANNPGKSLLEYWTLTKAGTLTASMVFHYLQTDVPGTSNEANYRIIRVVGTTPASFPQSCPSTSCVDTAANTATISGVSNFSDWTVGEVLAPTASDGVVTGRIVDSNGRPVEGAVVRLGGTQNRKFITDANGFYRFEKVETNGFYTVTPSRANYSFNPSVRSFSQIGETTEAAFGATLASSTFVNPLDTPEYFVRQHYLDFLGREPDEAGFNFWSDQILECATDQNCIERRRENVSAAYFLSIEFQKTGGLVDGLYKASYGVRPQFAEFMPDTRALAVGVVVGKQGWEELLETNKQTFMDAFVNRPAFHAAYDGLSSSDFVDALISHTGVSFTGGERDALLSGLTMGTMTRADVLRSIAENNSFVNAKFNETFVMMEYFGYLRRDPDTNGYAFWLNKLNEFTGNFERAEMVKAFIVSGEFRDRFPR